MLALWCCIPERAFCFGLRLRLCQANVSQLSFIHMRQGTACTGHCENGVQTGQNGREALRRCIKCGWCIQGNSVWECLVQRHVKPLSFVMGRCVFILYVDVYASVCFILKANSFECIHHKG